MKKCVLSVSTLLLCAGLGAGEPMSKEAMPPVQFWPSDVEFDPSLVDLTEPETPEWVERLRNSRGEPDCDLVGDPDEFDYVVRLTTWSGLVPDRIVYIDASAPLGGDGSSWQSAYQSLHDALSAENFDTELLDIRMAQGLYRADRMNGVDTLDADLTYNLPGITVTDGVPTGVMRIAGGFAGRNGKNPDARDLELYQTVFTGDLLGNDTDQHENYEDNTKVMFEPGLTELNGIEIEHGRIAVYEGRWITDCTVRWCNAEDFGLPVPNANIAPVYVKNARVVGNSFSNNKGLNYGGALKPDGSTVVVANCRFTRNSAPTGGAIGTRYFTIGEANCTLVIQNCFFANNISDSYRGGYGGAVFSGAIQPQFTQIIHSTFVGNETVGGFGIATVGTLNSLTSFNSVYDQNFAFNDTGIEAELGCLVVFGINLSIVEGNVFRRYNENLIDDPRHPGFRLNQEAVTGFGDLFGPDGEFGTPDDDPSLGQGSESIGHSVLPPSFNNAANYELGLFDIADLDGDCDRTEPIPVDIFGNPRAFESVPGEGIEGYPADAGCAEYIPSGRGLPAQDWIVPDRSIVDLSSDPIRLYVSSTAAPGGDGSSWSSAMTNPAEALAVAAGRVGPVEIWVVEGVYPAPVSASRVDGFQIVENATLLGGFAGSETSVDQRDPTAFVTVLTGDVLGNDDLDKPETLIDNTRHVVVSVGRRGGGVIDGFALREGSPSWRSFGAGIYANNGWMSEFAAGIIFSGSGNLSLRNCEIGPIPVRQISSGIAQNPMIELDGQMSNLILDGCVVTSDTHVTDLNSYSTFVTGRSVQPELGWGDLHIRNSYISVPSERRIVRSSYAGHTKIERSKLYFNTFWSTAGFVSDSRKFSIMDSEVILTTGGIIRTQNTPLEISGSTVFAPTVTVLALGFPQLQVVSLKNSVFAVEGNISVQLPSPTNSITHSGNIFPASFLNNLPASGPTNTTFDFASNAAAFFIDPLGADGLPNSGDEDLRLAPGSPAINTGLNAFVESDFDLDGNPRIIGSVVDRGAYEFTGTCTGDFNGDGVIDLDDLNIILSNFGQPLPFGDADGSGTVDLDDLNIVLTLFGQQCVSE